MDGATDGESLVIENNIFGTAPVGAALYSIISPEAEAQIHLNNNVYTKNDILLIQFGHKNYTDFTDYQKETCQDKDSRIN